jgi:hypothetical protein
MNMSKKSMKVGDRVTLIHGYHPNNQDYIGPGDVLVVTKTYDYFGKPAMDLACSCCTVPDEYELEFQHEFEKVAT